jgi:hypothetical protein
VSDILAAIPTGLVAMRLGEDIQALVRDVQTLKAAYDQLTKAIDALGYRDAVVEYLRRGQEQVQGSPSDAGA